MESVQVTISNNNVNNKVEFHGIKNTYPVGENVVCYFSFPSVSSGKPESQDWIGIFPVGWKSIKEVLCKKFVSVESQIGKVEFEVEMLPKGEQYYQFVYVKNGELIRGASTPFTFVGEYKNGGIKSFEGEQIFGGKYYNEFYPTTTTTTPVEQQWSSIPSTWGVPSKSTIGNGIEQIFGQVQTGLVGLEQTLKGLKTFNGEELISSWCPEGIFATKPIGGEYKWWTQMTEPQQIKKFWSQKVNEIESVLREQIKIEYAHRKLEQLNILTQLKSFERHIMNVQKREQEIKEFLHCKMQKQIREFEQKVYNVMKLSVELNGQQQQQQQQQPEYYVKKYEQLLREKIQLDQAKRQIVSNKLRESIKECERKLREIQSVEFHFFNRFHQQLRNKIAQEFESKHVRSIILGGEFSEKIDLHLREQLKNVIVQFFFEQQKEQLHFVKVHKQLVNLVCDMACKLQELECEAYTHLRIPRISSVFPIELHPTYTQVKSLEQQIFDLKTLLRNKMGGNNVNIPSFLTCGEWIRPIVQKLRELEWNLRQEKINFEQHQQQFNGEFSSSSVRGLWFERRLEKLAKQMKFFEQHMEVRQLEEVRLREIFAQLKDLECELYELPQFFEQYYGKFSPMMMTSMINKPSNGQQYKQIVELCLFLQQIVKEKIQHLQTSIPSIQSVYGGLFNGECNVSSTVYYPTTPIEFYIQSGVQHQQTLKQLLAYERKIVELKSLLVEREHLKGLKERLVDLQQLLREITVSGKQQEKFVEQINRLFKTVLEQTCFMDSELQTSVFVPELYQTVVQKYEKLYQLINELESHLIEKRQQISSVYPRQQQQQIPTPFEYEQTFYQQQQQQQQITTPSSTQTTLYFIHQKFEKLVQEFLRQLPRQVEVEYMPKCEQIISFLKSVQLATSEYKYGSSNKQFLSKELKEKMVDFERILCELFDSEKVFALPSAWTITSTIVPVNMQSPKEYIRILIKLVRELRSQIQNVVSVDGEWELVEDLNNNGLVCEPIEVLSGHEGILADLVEKYTQFYTRQTPKQTTTTTQLFDEEYVTPKMNKFFSLPTTTRRQQLEREIENFESLSTSDLINLNAVPSTLSNGRQYQKYEQQQQQQSSNIENLLVELESELVKLRLQKNMPFNQQQLQSQQQRIASSMEIIDELVSKFVDSEESLLKTVVPENKQTIVEQPMTFNGIRITRESNQF